MRTIMKILFAATVSITVSGCATGIGYYSQSIGGQLSIMSRRVPLDEMINNPDEHPSLVARLKHVQTAREFAITELKLPDSGSYKTYVHLDESYPVWNVVAAPRFSLEPETWCYVFVGCLAYRGYFNEQRARKFAAKQIKRGLDVTVNGAIAYSTLGWFKDPIFSSMLRLDDVALVEAIFHELAHELLFVKGATDFNEAFASAVAEEGIKRWLVHIGAEDDIALYEKANAREKEFNFLIARARGHLQEVYALDVPPQDKQARKRQAFAKMRAEYELLKTSWEGFDGYDWWFNRELNNAHLVSVATYGRLQPAFRMLLREKRGDLESFYAACEALGELSAADREKELQRLTAIANSAATD